MMADPTDYLVARLHEALTHDPRVHDQSLEVRVEGQRVVLRGELATPERCQAAIAVAKELFPEATVVADLKASPERPAPDAEHL
jgi:osmotically-inducible protein OsmY